jgi:hypothetical protein
MYLPNLANNRHPYDSLAGVGHLRTARCVAVNSVVIEKKHLLLILVPVMVGGLPILALADNTETAKLVTEDAFPVDAGSTELEFGYQYVTADTLFDTDGDVIARGDLEGQIIIAKATYGIRERLDASIEVMWRHVIKDADSQLGDGIGNVTVSAKWLFYQDDEKGLAVAWVPGFTAPFAGDALNERLAPGQVYWSINNLLVLTYVVGGFNLNLDVGHFLALGNDRGDQRSEFIGDIAVGRQLSSWLQLEAELNYGHLTVNRGNGSVNFAVTVGAIMNVSNSVRIDVGLQQVLDGRNADKHTFWLANLSKTF